MYVGRSDNVLNQKFHITPRQLYTLFSQQLEEVQEPPQEEKQVSLNYEPPFDENPSDKEIIEALIKHLKEQDGFLTAIDCVSTKAILTWLEKQKEQKPLHWRRIEDATTQRTDDGCCVTSEKMLVKGWINDEDYRIVDEGTMVNRDILCIPVRELNAEQKEQNPVDYEAELKKCKDNPLYFYEKYVSIKQKSEWSEEDEAHRDFILESLESQIRFCKKDAEGAYYAKQIRTAQNWLKFLPERFNLQPKAELTLLDENIINAAVAFVEQNNHFNYWGGIDKRTVIKALRSLKPHWKPSEEEMRTLDIVISDYRHACTKDSDKKAEILKPLLEQLKKL